MDPSERTHPSAFPVPDDAPLGGNLAAATSAAETLEEAVKLVLRETHLTPEERDTLEKAVRIARALKKAPRPEAKH